LNVFFALPIQFGRETATYDGSNEPYNALAKIVEPFS
jgi:hypothetical protein